MCAKRYLDASLGYLNVANWIGEPSTNNLVLASTIGVAGLVGYIKFKREYTREIQRHREEFELEAKKYQDQLEKKKALQEKKARERKENADKKKAQVEQKKQQQQERAAKLQKEREEKAELAKQKAAENAKKEKSPSQIDVSHFFGLQPAEQIAIFRDSLVTMQKQVSTLGAAASRVSTPQARRVALRNQSIATQLSNISTEQFAALTLDQRVEAGLWLAYFSALSHADLIRNGTKAVELIRDQKLVIRLLDIPDTELETATSLTPNQIYDIHKTSLDSAMLIDDLQTIEKAYTWIYSHSRLAGLIANGGALAKTPDDLSPQALELSDADSRGLYLALPVEERAKMQTNLDVFAIIAILPIAPILGKWTHFRALCHDYLLFSPGQPYGSGLEELQRSYSQVPQTPDFFALYKLATSFSPTIEDRPETQTQTIDVITETITDEMSPEERTTLEEKLAQDTKKRFAAFVDEINFSLSNTTEKQNLIDTPLPATQQDYIAEQLRYDEYHIRSLLTTFNPTKSYHKIPSNISNYKATSQEPKLFNPNERKIIARGAIAAIQDLNTGAMTFHFGPHDPASNEFIAVSEHVRAVARNTVLQAQVIHLTRGEENVFGKSSWVGYIRITQTPKGEKEPNFSFFFDIQLETQRVLSPEEQIESDKILAQMAAEKAKADEEAAIAQAKADEEAALAKAEADAAAAAADLEQLELQRERVIEQAKQAAEEDAVVAEEKAVETQEELAVAEAKIEAEEAAEAKQAEDAAVAEEKIEAAVEQAELVAAEAKIEAEEAVEAKQAEDAAVAEEVAEAAVEQAELVAAEAKIEAEEAVEAKIQEAEAVAEEVAEAAVEQAELVAAEAKIEAEEAEAAAEEKIEAVAEEIAEAAAEQAELVAEEAKIEAEEAAVEAQEAAVEVQEQKAEEQAVEAADAAVEQERAEQEAELAPIHVDEEIQVVRPVEEAQ